MKLDRRIADCEAGLLWRKVATARSHCSRRTKSAFCMLAVIVATATPVIANPRSESASSSRAARDEAVRSIPWRRLEPADRNDAQRIVKHASIFRRFPTRVIDCDPEMFTFLVQHPEVIVNVWRVMGVSRVTLDKLPDGVFQGSDGAGTTGVVRYLYTNWGEPDGNHAVVFADGAYEGKPLVKPIRAQTLMLMHWHAVQETNGRHYITVRVDSFVHIDQLGVELIAKTVQPWITRTADQNFIETLTFVSNFSRTAEQNPQGMERLAARLSKVDESTRNELVQICFRTAERYAKRDDAHRTSHALLARHDDLAASEQQ